MFKLTPGADGSIALFAICFDGLAVYFWFKGLRKTALFIGMIAGLAFVVTFSNSLGSIASRSDAVEASRQETTDARKDDREELKRLRAELVNLHDTPTNDEAVAAAKRLADTASENRRLECDKRGPNCRQRELDDAAAASALAAATASESPSAAPPLMSDRRKQASPGPCSQHRAQALNPIGDLIPMIEHTSNWARSSIQLSDAERRRQPQQAQRNCILPGRSKGSITREQKHCWN